MPQGGEPRLAQEEVQAHREDPENQGLRHQSGVGRGYQPADDGQDDHAEDQPEPEHDAPAAPPPTLSHTSRSPSASIMAIGAKMVELASSGNRAHPDG